MSLDHKKIWWGEKMKNISDTFGSMVFNDTVMKARLSQDAYKALKRTISQGTPAGFRRCKCSCRGYEKLGA